MDSAEDNLASKEYTPPRKKGVIKRYRQWWRNHPNNPNNWTVQQWQDSRVVDFQLFTGIVIVFILGSLGILLFWDPFYSLTPILSIVVVILIFTLINDCMAIRTIRKMKAEEVAA